MITTRFAPSPTGLLHIGNYRTAIFSYLFAHQNKGKFILRIEDTDKERSKKEYEENIVESLKWLGLEYDEFYRQSDLVEEHTKLLQKLIDSDKAYLDGELVRLRNVNKLVTFHDLIRGDISFDTTELGDFIIAKTMNRPLFHFAVVVDDYMANVTHIIRGEDHISNTPRQILIYEALEFKIPQYAHLPLVLDENRAKLSKRKGALSLLDYKEKGYSPETMVNAIAFLGWNPGNGNNKEVYTKEELIKDFDITKVKKGGACLSEDKLKWFQKKHS